MAIGDTYQLSPPYTVEGNALVSNVDPDGAIIYVMASDASRRFRMVVFYPSYNFSNGMSHEAGSGEFIEVGPYSGYTPVTVDNGAAHLVIEGWSQAKTYADSAFTRATGFLDQLNAVMATLGDIPTVDTTISHLTLDVSAFDNLIGLVPLPPVNTASFVETPYTSAYLTDLRVMLDSWVTGTSTGIAPAVEQAIWDRGRARETAIATRKARDVVRQFAMRGFTKPQLAMDTAIQEAKQDAQNAAVSTSREIMIKQADLEQTNRKFAIEQVWKVEEGMMTYLGQQMVRAMEMAKAAQQYITEVYKQEIEAYSAQAGVYTAKVNAATTVFKAEVDANVAEANLRVEAAKANVQRLIQQVTLLVETIKAGAQVSSQLAASALSAVNLSGGLSASTNDSASNTASTTRGTSESHSTQSSSSTSNDTSVSTHYNYSL